ncbi:MAG: hypothetical protein H8E40_16385 [Chloroflexi bacterium]|nr:hypothetical protein [Chloroflexota bacterium]
MKESSQKVLHILQFVMTVLLCASTIFLLVQTIILTQWTARTSWSLDRIAADTASSYGTIVKSETGISNLVKGLTGDDSQFIEQLGGIKDDTEAAKGALGKIEGDIDDIRSDVGKIEGKVDSIKELLSSPSD